MIGGMSRCFYFRLATLWCMVVTVSSCVGNPPPRRYPVAQPVAPVVQQPVRMAAVPPTPPPPVVGESAIVIDVQSGRVLYA